MAEDLEYLIELEYDSVKNQELGATFSKPQLSESKIVNDVVNVQAGSESSGRSYLSISPKTIQTVKPNHTLFVWHAAFHPGIGRRFTSVVISCKLSAPKPVSFPKSQGRTTAVKAVPVRIVAHAPHKSFGGCSRETKKTTWGLEFPIIFTGAGNVGVAPTVAKEKGREIEHAFTVIGTARGAPHKHTCVWTIEENASTARGVPSEVQLATLIYHDSPVQCDVTVSGRVSGGVLPPYYLRAKTAAEERRKVIEPGALVGLLYEYELNGDLECERLLKSWTGEVEGAVLDFNQSIIQA